MNQEVQLLYLQFTDLWKALCEEHNQLFQVTCEEYISLLNSDIENVHKLLEQKQNIMKSITALDDERSAIVSKIANLGKLPADSISKFKHVYHFLSTELNLNNNNPLIKYHQVIIDLIEKIQEQNKKNRVFLNKALMSIQTMRKELAGSTKIENYSRTGERQAHCR